MLVVHTAFRREFRLLPGLVRATPVGDAKHAARVAAHLDLITNFLHHHHTGEDTLLWPRRLPKRQLPLAFGLMSYEGDPEVLKLMLASAPPPVRVLLPRLSGRAFRRYAQRIHGTATP